VHTQAEGAENEAFRPPGHGDHHSAWHTERHTAKRNEISARKGSCS
jgi:hypothetical protein